MALIQSSSKSTKILHIFYRSSIKKSDRVIIIDDVLATGGTMAAGVKLVEGEGGIVVGVLLINCIKGLNGVENIGVGKEKVYWIY